MPLPYGVYRADQVGSLLRSKAIKESRIEWAEGRITLEQLREIEDREIEEVVKGQIAAGLRAVTDGEFRRAYFHIDFLQNLKGVERRGAIVSTHATRDGWMPPRLVVTSKLGHPKPIQLDDYKYLEKSITVSGKAGTVTPKVSIPSPTMVHFRGGRDTIDNTAYPELDVFFDDLARVYQEEISDLYKAGCRFLQLDDTNLAYLCDPAMRASAEERHGDASQLTERYASLINAAISKRPKDMTIGIHLCRGNNQSQWFAQGGYEPVAEVLFKKLNVDVYFLEFDDARSGDFSPLRFLPENKVVVLGVMSSKLPELGDKQEIIRRLKEAAFYCPKGLDQLCLSHQCGFSSTEDGNELSHDQQWAKLRLEVTIAKEVWGEDISV